MIFFLFLKKGFWGYKMKETHITIYIHDLEISDKSKSFLGRVGLMRLNDLLNCDMMELSATRNISEDVLQELNGVIAHADDIICFFEERAKRIKEILPDVQDTPIESLRLGTRATNALRRGGIHTVGALIQMSQKDIFELRNVGVLSREEITKAIESIIQSGKVVHHERAEEPEAVIETTPESSRLSKQFPQDTILMCCDGAAWHKSGTLEVPENIVLFHIPPYTPEMNPIEQIWKEIRKRGFRNEVFASLEKVVDRLCDTICSLTPNTIFSITGRDWIIEAFN